MVKVKIMKISRCALWSWLDQRAMLPPKCVGVRVSTEMGTQV